MRLLLLLKYLLVHWPGEQGLGAGRLFLQCVEAAGGRYLFKLKNVLVEVVLEPLVGKVDAELFKAVVLVVLEAKDIKNTNGQDLKGKNRIECITKQC